MKLFVIVLVAAINLCTISFAGDKNKASQKILSGRSVQCNKGFLVIMIYKSKKQLSFLKKLEIFWLKLVKNLQLM